MVKIIINDDEVLCDMLVDRVSYWTNDADVLTLYEKYYSDLISCGCFDDAKLDIYEMVDNDYVNYTAVVDSSELESQYNIKADEADYSDRILVSMPEKDLYLIRTY